MPESAWIPKAPRKGAFFMPLLLLALWLPLPTAAEMVMVRHVIDGDTVVLDDGRHVRLIGINAPEIGRNGRPNEPIALSARHRLRGLVGLKQLRLVTGKEKRDRHGRLLAHLLIGDKPVQLWLLRQGYASVIAHPPNLRYLAWFQQQEDFARKHRLGIWEQRFFQPVTATAVSERHLGFRLIRGRVERIRRSRRHTYLILTPELELQVPHRYRKYFPRRLEAYRGIEVEARGWLTQKNGKFRLRVRHPAMLKSIEH